MRTGRGRRELSFCIEGTVRVYHRGEIDLTLKKGERGHSSRQKNAKEIKKRGEKKETVGHTFEIIP